MKKYKGSRRRNVPKLRTDVRKGEKLQADNYYSVPLYNIPQISDEKWHMLSLEGWNNA
jgi:hypothetical protein